MKKLIPELLVFDIDNTLFDWIPYYAVSNAAVLAKLETLSMTSYAQLVREFKEVAAHYDSINDGEFIVQRLPSIKKIHSNINVSAVQRTCTDIFLNKAKKALVPYEGVLHTLDTIKRHSPSMAIVALTDSPFMEAVWKLDMLKVEKYFDGVYGMNVPPLVPTAGVMEKISYSCRRYRGRMVAMPKNYEKPSPEGLKKIMHDFGFDETEKDRVVYVGDNLRKDVKLGKDVGVLTCWSEFSLASDSPSLQGALALSSKEKITQNSPDINDLRLRPDVRLTTFADLLQVLF